MRWLSATASMTLMGLVALSAFGRHHPLENFPHSGALTVAALVLAAALLALTQGLTDRAWARRRQSDQRLADSLRLKSEILDSAPYAIVSSAPDGTITSFNAAAERMLGYRAAEVIGRATPMLWHDPPELDQRMPGFLTAAGPSVSTAPAALLASARPGNPHEQDWTFIRRDGSRFRGSMSVSALTGPNQAVTGYLAIISDSGERLRQQAELRASEDRFRRAFDDAPIGMALVSPAGRWLKVNRVLCEMLGYASEELVEHSILNIKHPEDREQSAEHIREAMTDAGRVYQMEKRYLHRNGSTVYALLSLSPARDPTGALQYFIAQVEDITQRRQVERIKKEFVSTVSHELRTPLTSIHGSLGLLAAGVAGKLSEKSAAMVKIAHQNSERLVRIINDILDIEKIESGKLELHCQSVSLNALLQQSIEGNQPYADRFQVRFVLHPQPQDDTVFVDPDRFMQIMANLMSNAVKFSPAGAAVEIRAGRRELRIRIEVQDHGSGIPEEFRTRVFEKFAQADSASTRRFDGTGLGLSITRQLTELMGGSIGFATHPGEGTTFYVELPRAADLTHSPPAPRPDPGSPTHNVPDQLP